MKKPPKNKNNSTLPAWMPDTLRQRAPGKPSGKKHPKAHPGKSKTVPAPVRHGGSIDQHFHRELQRYD
ncbi:MAG: hypothetical protein KAZ58_01785, partial [Arenimonas sp.]|nr:hypothetical protein [Arenimonas sp.]